MEKYRVVWMEYAEPDPKNPGGRLIKAIWPRKVPVRCRTWRQGLRDFWGSGGFDVLMLGAVVALFVISLVIR